MRTDEDAAGVHEAEPRRPGSAERESDRRGPSRDAEGVPRRAAASQQPPGAGGGRDGQGHGCHDRRRQAGVVDRPIDVAHHQQAGREADRTSHQRSRYPQWNVKGKGKGRILI